MEHILGHLLGGDPALLPIDGVDAWWRRHLRAAEPFEQPVDRALAGGFASDRLGFAFASGYTEALRCLLPELAALKTALCATERAGNRPRHIETALVADGAGWRMTGEKTFATLGRHAEQLVVLAADGTDERGRNRLAAVIIPSSRDGVSMTDGPATPFAPEISHARTRFDSVRVEPHERLAGDGYDRYLRPFRTVEDCHVWAAAIAWWIQVARRCDWPPPVVGRLASLAAGARAVAMADPTSPAVHVAFGGLAEQTQQVLDAAEPLWDRVDSATRRRWARDRPLLSVAAKARTARLEVARARLSE